MNSKTDVAHQMAVNQQKLELAHILRCIFPDVKVRSDQLDYFMSWMDEHTKAAVRNEVMDIAHHLSVGTSPNYIFERLQFTTDEWANSIAASFEFFRPSDNKDKL